MKLLVEPKYLPPSADYLYARIGCREQGLLAGRGGAPQQRNPQRHLRKEYRWVYFHLERRLRRQLRPVFEYSELRLLVLGVRYLAAGELKAFGELLRQSLLPPRLQRKLLAAPQAVAAVAVLERLLADDCPVFRGVTECYLRQGPGGVEQQLLGGYLQQAMAVSRPAPVRELLVYLLDMRNLLALYKHLRWQLPQAPPLLSGGELSVTVIERCWQQQDLAALLRLARKRAGLNVEAELADIEDLLEEGVAKRLRQQAREPLQIGVLLDYLWLCRRIARNSVLPGSERQPVEVEG